MNFYLLIASITVYFYILIKYNNMFLKQQVLFLVVYIICLTIVGELDLLLPVYFIFSILPFIKHIKKISLSSFIIFVYLFFYLVYGIIFQNITGTFVSFISKIWQFVIFLVVYESDIALIKEDCTKIILIAVTTETLLGLYLLATGTNIDANGLTRLVSNSQPITGNVSTVALPIIVYVYCFNCQNPKLTRYLFYSSAVMFLWIILSGTRGYTVEFFATMFLILFDYLVNTKISKKSIYNRMIIVYILIFIVLIVVLFFPSLLVRFESVLRIKSSVGIRTFENKAVIDYLKNAPLKAVFFGIGLGGQAGSYIEMKNSLYTQFSLGMWNYDHYLSGYGSLFHNLYANVVLYMGILGIFFIVSVNIKIWHDISNSCCKNSLIKNSLHLYQISFLFMNYYRWSAVCGITEMIVLALTLKMVQKHFDN